jgi:hypothetical protein
MYLNTNDSNMEALVDDLNTCTQVSPINVCKSLTSVLVCFQSYVLMTPIYSFYCVATSGNTSISGRLTMA